jgi:hypothetical protein
VTRLRTASSCFLTTKTDVEPIGCEFAHFYCVDTFGVGTGRVRAGFLAGRCHSEEDA